MYGVFSALAAFFMNFDDDFYKNKETRKDLTKIQMYLCYNEQYFTKLCQIPYSIHPQQYFRVLWKHSVCII